FEGAVGPFPRDILKMINMIGIWPGGGMFVIPAPGTGEGMAVYTTFGLSNPDLLEPPRDGRAGYGYEAIVVAPEGEDWPLNLPQWLATAEAKNDAGLLDRVEKYSGLTVEGVEVGLSQPMNILISKARPPLPVGTRLPAGQMEVLVITTITAEEMAWSMTNGRAALLEALMEAGTGQASDPARASVVH